MGVCTLTPYPIPYTLNLTDESDPFTFFSFFSILLLADLRPREQGALRSESFVCVPNLFLRAYLVDGRAMGCFAPPVECLQQLQRYI